MGTNISYCIHSKPHSNAYAKFVFDAFMNFYLLGRLKAVHKQEVVHHPLWFIADS